MIAFVADLGSATQSHAAPNSTDLTLTVPAGGVAAGSRLVIAVTRYGGVVDGTVDGASDTKGNTYAIDIGTGNGHGQAAHLLSAHVGTALVAGDVITVGLTDVQMVAARFLVYSGIASADAVDVTGVKGDTEATDTRAFPAATSGGPRLFVGVLGSRAENADGDGPAAAPGVGWTERAAVHLERTDAGITYVMDVFPEDRIVSLAGSYVVNWTYTPNQTVPPDTYNWIIVSAAYKPADGSASAPTAPSGLSVDAATASTLLLSWTQHSDNEAAFEIERSVDGATGWALVGTTVQNVTSFTDLGLDSETTYYYRVRAVNSTGDSTYAATASGTTLAAVTTAPDAPSDVTVDAIGSTRLLVSWTDNSDNESGFRIERSPDGDSSWLEVGVVGAGVTAFTNTGLEPETTYYYRVRAYNASGGSAYSAVGNGTTLAAGTGGAGECGGGRYASVADVQSRVWTSVLTITDSAEPSRAQVEDWLCEISRWVDATFAWRYVVPVVDGDDVERLRPAVSALVASLCWDVLVTRNPGQEHRAQELKAEGFAHLVYHPGGTGTFLPGGAVAIATAQLGSSFGRSFLPLPNTAEAGETSVTRRETPVSNFRAPGVDGVHGRLFSRDREV